MTKGRNDFLLATKKNCTSIKATLASGHLHPPVSTFSLLDVALHFSLHMLVRTHFHKFYWHYS